MRSLLPPGPAAPALVQTWRWMSRPPLGLLDEHAHRYGDVFRLELLGPRYREEHGRSPLARRTVVVFSRPQHVQEIFARGDDGLPAGRAREFLEWFMGPRSIMLLDGAAHHQERRELSPLFAPDRLQRFASTMTAAAERALARWPAHGSVDLHGLLDLALEELNLALAVGTAAQTSDHLLDLTRRARRSFAAPLHFLPLLRADVGPWSPGGRLAAFRRGLYEVVREWACLPGSPGRESESCLLGGLVAPLREGAPPSDAELTGVVERIITLLGGMDNTSAAVAWACRHILRDPAVSARVREEVAGTERSSPPGPGSYLQAVLLESLRLTPPVPALVRRARGPVGLGGFELPSDTFVLASLYLLHRREELFPEPTAFKPERFLAGMPRGGYAPFGSGSRSCLGATLALLQMRVLLSAIWRRFELTPEQPVSLAESRRNVTVVPAGPLPVTLRARSL